MAVLALTAVGAAGLPSSAAAAPEWRLEQPPPPPPRPGVEPSAVPVGLGHVGDMEFLEPNLALLSTHGNGHTVPPGVWAYNGAGWREIATECGATDGRIAWAGPEDFWTVADGRAGQAANPEGLLPPLENNTLCHFLGLRKQNLGAVGASIAASYASLAFTASSYQQMHGAACIGPEDCWFAGDRLPEPQQGAFHLHWSGSGVEAEANTKANAVGDLRAFEGKLIESISLTLRPAPGEHTPEEILHPPVLAQVPSQAGARLFTPLHLRSAQEEATTLPEYAPGSFPAALGPLHLAANESSLWAAAGPVHVPPEKSAPAKLTVLRHVGSSLNQGWTELLGPAIDAKREEKAEGPPSEDVVTSIAAEPGTSSAWIALDTVEDANSPNPKPNAMALVAHVSAEGAVTEEELPTQKEREKGVGGLGAAARIACPAQNECWLITTQGWLFHLADEGSRVHPVNPDPAINGPLITFRPRDEGLPQIPSDTLPPDTSGLGEAPLLSQAIQPEIQQPASISLPLVSHVHVRLVHRSTLELSFELAVRARVRLLARRRRSIVASTHVLTLGAGRRKLTLRLNPHRWPTKLDLQARPLAPLPTVSTRGAAVETVGTTLAFPRPGELLGTGPSR
jgi:hypothetical protein